MVRTKKQFNFFLSSLKNHVMLLPLLFYVIFFGKLRVNGETRVLYTSLSISIESNQHYCLHNICIDFTHTN